MYSNDFYTAQYLGCTATLACVLASSLLGSNFGVPAFFYEVFNFNLIEAVITNQLDTLGMTMEDFIRETREGDHTRKIFANLTGMGL